MFLKILLVVVGLGLTDMSTLKLIPAGEFENFFKDSKTKKKEKQAVPAFLLDTHPVTNADYLKFVQSNPSWKKSEIPQVFAEDQYLVHWKGDLELGPKAPEKAPVVNVSWFAARAYCQFQGKRLPSVAEWERVGMGRDIPEDERKRESKRILEWNASPNPEVLPSTGQSKPNKFGIYDLFGLVWEWNEDFNSVMIPGRGEPQMEKMFCGAGSLGAVDPQDYSTFLRYGFRSSLKAQFTVQNLGFRCAKNAEGGTP